MVANRYHRGLGCCNRSRMREQQWLDVVDGLVWVGWLAVVRVWAVAVEQVQVQVQELVLVLERAAAVVVSEEQVATVVQVQVLVLAEVELADYLAEVLEVLEPQVVLALAGSPLVAVVVVVVATEEAAVVAVVVVSEVAAEAPIEAPLQALPEHHPSRQQGQI